jgi:nickel/cobalt transporter (NicO) family protein
MMDGSRDRIRVLPRCIPAAMLVLVLIVSAFVASAVAHPLGNFTINQYARLTVGVDRIDVRYVIDMAEISTLQELQKFASGGDGRPTAPELDQALERIAADYLSNLALVVDGKPVPLAITGKSIALPPGAGGLPTLRIEMNLVGVVPASPGETVRRLSFEDRNRRERVGWREIVVGAVNGTTIVDCDAYGNGLTDELKAYPQDMLAAPLREETASLSFTQGAPTAGAVPMRTRDGHSVVQSRDRVTDLINVPEVTPLVAALGLLFAVGFGALHAFAPGHGKTVVGAYLVGARASMRHAAFLGATVTVTHTLGVLALGIVTLFASRYILPEQLFPVLSFISGAIVLAMGLSLFVARLRILRAPDLSGQIRAHHVHHDNGHDHVHH